MIYEARIQKKYLETIFRKVFYFFTINHEINRYRMVFCLLKALIYSVILSYISLSKSTESWLGVITMCTSVSENSQLSSFSSVIQSLGSCGKTRKMLLIYL